MVLMGMGQDDAEKILAPLLYEADVRHEDVDARRRLVAERNAEVDHQPFAVDRIEIEIHPDLVRAAERQEAEIVCLYGERWRLDAGEIGRASCRESGCQYD